MEIVKNFPFDVCESCCECVLDVENQVLFFTDIKGDKCQRIITVGCKNESLCKRLKEQHNGKNH